LTEHHLVIMVLTHCPLHTCRGICILVGCGALLIAGSISPALAGLALSYALDLTRFLKFGTQVRGGAVGPAASERRILSRAGGETPVAFRAMRTAQ
jgi:hypothetical protein